MMRGSTKRKRKRGLYHAGEKGTNRVRLYPHPRNGTLMLEYFGNDGRRRNLSLRHTDVARGKGAADDLAASLRRGEEPSGDLTLLALFDKYDEEVTTGKTKAKQQHDRAARALFKRCWGTDAPVADLDKTHWDKFVRQRRSGVLAPGERKGKGVRNRMIQYDLKFLMAVFNWAENVIEKRRPLLERNPFRNCTMPKEESPRRPRITEVEYAALTKAAKELPSQVGLFLYLCHETGHRSKSISRLRWSDLDFERHCVSWRGEHDKLKREHETPLTAANVEVLKSARREAGSNGDGWVFPSPDDPEKPISRRELLRWWSDLEAVARLRRVPGRGWHSLRRKFADDNDVLPLSQLMAGGGWKSGRTITETYQAPDLDKLRVAMEQRAERRVQQLAATTTTNYNRAARDQSGELLEVGTVN
jgi:integrase